MVNLEDLFRLTLDENLQIFGKNNRRTIQRTNKYKNKNNIVISETTFMMLSAGSLICVAYFSLSLAPPRSRKCGGARAPPRSKKCGGARYMGGPTGTIIGGAMAPLAPAGFAPMAIADRYMVRHNCPLPMANHWKVYRTMHQSAVKVYMSFLLPLIPPPPSL